MVLEKLEAVDRSLFSQKEQLHLDLFLFSYYTGGMANVDVCHLTWDCIKEDKIIYERMKFPKQAKPLLIEKAKKIIEKYRGTGFENYIFQSSLTSTRQICSERRESVTLRLR